MTETRKLAAILAADVVGFSRMAGQDEDRTLARLRTLRSDHLDPVIAIHHGRTVKRIGDGLLVEFRSVVNAVRCAMELQAGMAERNAGVPANQRIEFRMGIHVGDVVEEHDGDLMGDGVNIAARLESISEPNGVCLSSAAYEQVRDRVNLGYIDLGARELKNIIRPVRVYQITLGSHDQPRPVELTKALADPNPTDRPSLAVLPFTNLTGDADQEYFADGVVEDIIGALSRIPWLFVIARPSSFTYKGRTIDVQQAGRELGVRYLLQGSVRTSGDRIRITGQLVEATSGRQIWGERFDEHLGDIFALQDHVAESVAVALEPTIRSVEIERAIRRPAESLAAYDLYLRALPHLYAYTASGFSVAEDLLRQSIKRSPRYADALAALAECLGRKAVNGWSATPNDDVAEVCDLSNRAVAADPGNAAALATAAWSAAQLGSRFAQSLELAERALQLHPNSAHVRSFCGWVALYSGDLRRAADQFEAARRLNPIDPRAYFTLLGVAAVHFFSGQFEDTLLVVDRILEEVPSHNVARRYRAASLAHLGRLDEASRESAQLGHVNPRGKVLPLGLSFRDREMAALYVDGLAKAGLIDQSAACDHPTGSTIRHPR